MFKKKDSYTLNDSIKADAESLSLLITSMQRNADQVEKAILQTEEKLAVDRENAKRDQTFQHQRENSESLTEAEKLLQDLFTDVERIKERKHPQADEIVHDVRNLQDRWLKNCTDYCEVYGSRLISWTEPAPRMAEADENGRVWARRTPISSNLEDNAKALISQLDKIDSDLEQSKRNILSRLRTPLVRSDPALDLSNRQNEQAKAHQVIKFLEQETAVVQSQIELISSQKPNGPTISELQYKLNAVKNKSDAVINLADLYTKKTNASVYLESQIKKVDIFVSGFEKCLVVDSAIPDVPNASRTHTHELQRMRREVADRYDEILRLSRDLESTEQLCISLQKGHQEYCPDIRLQEIEVKRLRNRYTAINDQLQRRESLMQEVSYKNQEFQNSSQSMNSFLNSLPNNAIKPSDGLSEVNTKLISQKRVVEDIKRKRQNLNQVVNQSQDLQSLLNEYDVNSDWYRSIVNKMETNYDKVLHYSTLAESVQKQEKALLNRYAQVSAENEQLLNQLEFARNLITQNDEKVSRVVVKHHLQLQSQQKSLDESDSLKRDLADEIARRSRAEADLDTYMKRMISLKSRRGVERVEEKETVLYYREPQLENNLEVMRSKIQDEVLKHSGTQTEIEVINQKIVLEEKSLKNIKPKLVTKVVTEFERDSQLEIEASKLREEMRTLRNEIRLRESETIQINSQITILEQKKPIIKERVIKKEVVKLEKDPEMLQAVRNFEAEISNQSQRCKSLNDEIFFTRGQINRLERVISMVQPKIVIQEVKRLEKDPDLILESVKLHTSIKEEKEKNNAIMGELANLQIQYNQVGKLKPKMEIKETVNEIYRVDPKTKVEIEQLKKELQDYGKHQADMVKEIQLVMVEVQSLRSQKPKVELKEVIQEVVKEERSPEIIREMQRLNDQLSSLQRIHNNTQNQLNSFRTERDEWKTKKSKVETKRVIKEVIKYENDPLLEKEADRLRIEVRDEITRRRTAEETIFDLQNKYILLERQKPEEKVVIQEVLHLERDPKQILEHEKLSRSLDEEIKSRRKLELEVQQLRALVKQKELDLIQMDDRKKKIQVEIELKQIQSCINHLENNPPPITEKIVIEEVVQLERDPQLEKLANTLITDIDKERNNIVRLEKDIQNLSIKLDILQREKSKERTLYKEVILIEKDPAVESERNRLREQVSKEKNARLDLEAEIKWLNAKLNRFQTTMTTTSEEETHLIQNRNLLLKEKDDLCNELRKLESKMQDITISFHQQSKLMSERNLMNKQQSIKLVSEMESLEKEILNEKDKIHKRENNLKDLQNALKETRSETQVLETKRSTKITIMNPETGKNISPYDAYVEGLIDRNHYINLQELECDWEEITSVGLDGQTIVLQDRKSGRQYSVSNALKDGRLTQFDIQRYRDGKIHIAEFALLVAGETKPKPSTMEQKTPASTPYFSHSSKLTTSSAEECFPISGLIDSNTGNRMSVRSALTRQLIDPSTGQKLLEAQAATGGIVDINNRSRYSIHKAAECGLIDRRLVKNLLNAQKAFTGVEDPKTKERLSVGQAVQKGWMPKDSAKRFMEAQVLTGGLLDPNKAGRLSTADALKAKIIDKTMADELQDYSTYTKDLVDPVTNEIISYKEAMARCKKDKTTDLPMLPVTSTESTEMSAHTSYRSTSHSQV